MDSYHGSIFGYQPYWGAECHLSHWVSLSKSAEHGRTASFPAKSGWCSNISPKTQPAAHISTEVLLGGRLARIFSHPMIHHGWSLRAEPGGWSTSKSLGNRPLIPVKPGSFLFCLDFCQALIPKHMRVNVRKDETFMRWDGKNHIFKHHFIGTTYSILGLW